MTQPAKRYPLGAVIVIALCFWAACFGLAYVADRIIG